MSRAPAAVPSIASVRSATPTDFNTDDQSPFGVQGLTRGTLKVLKPDCITRLAVALAMRGVQDFFQDAGLIREVLAEHAEWIEEYQVIHLIEKSLWIRGHSDLVMTMLRNPTQIPDNPPPKILKALSRAYELHPDATIWYGVPLFGDEENEEGLPLPVTAPEVEAESMRRIEAAVAHAARWGIAYRLGSAISRIPWRIWLRLCITYGQIRSIPGRLVDYFKQVRADIRRREKAAIMARLERCREGRAKTIVPKPRTWLGRGLEAAGAALSVVEDQAEHAQAAAPFLGLALSPLALATFSPMLFVPMTVVSVDPFLFVELPDEPGKLRHLGHWYWQTKECGEKQLHLHV